MVLMKWYIFKIAIDYRGLHWKGILIKTTTEVSLLYLVAANAEADQGEDAMQPHVKN
jgi:hypothetical protein